MDAEMLKQFMLDQSNAIQRFRENNKKFLKDDLKDDDSVHEWINANSESFRKKWVKEYKINNALTIISGNAQLLLLDPVLKLSPEQTDKAAAIIKECSVISDLLAE